MTPLRILHVSDIHFDRENQEAALASLQTFYQHGRDNGVDLWVIAGDLFNRAVANTAVAGFPRLITILQNMMNLAPIVAVQGTPTHDIPGCYEALEEIAAKHSFTMLAPRSPYFLQQDGSIRALTADPEESDLLILGCPEPSKEWFLRNKEGLGRDETTQAIVDGMRQLLLGLGAIRRQYAALPCLMVYHGAIQGASLANGQLLPMGEIAVGRDDLALVGADYYALGHIHLAQQVGDLPAYYAGSAYPCNWGETDQKSFNQVTIESDLTRTEFISFPHPRRKKIVLSGTECAAGIEGFQVWEVRRLVKGDSFDTDAEQAWLETHGALPGSRVTVEIIPTEIVRAGQIQQARSLPEKIIIYAENSGEKIPGKALDKALQLAAEAHASGQAGEGLHIRIDRLRLRGTIGVWKGLGQDEIDLDLAAYDPGLIALVGANGRGKTTLIENMHPYTEMLTRQGKLQDHFRLKDSYRDLHFTDDRSRQQYRALIQIDGVNASGRAEYHLYRDGQPLTNGRKEDYEQTVERLFGSLSLFVRSAFVSQKPPKNHPDLTDATKGEKKALFRELAGLDYLQAYSEAARERAKALEAETERDRGRAETLEGMLAIQGEKKTDLQNYQSMLIIRSAHLQKAEIASKAMKTEVEELRSKVEHNREIEARLRELELRDTKLSTELEDIAHRRPYCEQAFAAKSQLERMLARIEILEVEQEELHGKQAGVLKERERLSAEHRNAEKIVADLREKNAAKIAKTTQEMALLEQKKANYVKQVDELEERLATQIECPNCHHRFHPDAEALQAKIKSAQEEAWETDKALDAAGEELDVCMLEKKQIIDPWMPVLPIFDDARLREIVAKLAQLDEPAVRKALASAQEAEVRLQEGNKRAAAISGEQAALHGESHALAGELLAPELEQVYEKAKADMAGLEAQYRACRDEVKTLEASIAALEKQLTELAERAQELEQLTAAIAGKQRDAAEWRYLERACGPDGVQALELDAMGPGIAEVANRILGVCYAAYPWDNKTKQGNPFDQVCFETTRIAGSGRKTKQVEDFEIFAHDVRDDTWTSFSLPSGGESIWLKRAIYDAFGIIRDRSTGQRFLTCFQDEADGALDPEARLAYFRMLEAAHQEAGRKHTLVITHSLEAQEMVQQKINMDSFVIQGVPK